MLSNYANSSFIVACEIFYFLPYCINGVSVTQYENRKKLDQKFYSMKTLDLCQKLLSLT